MGAVNLIEGFYPGAPGHDLTAKQRVDQGRLSDLIVPSTKVRCVAASPSGLPGGANTSPILWPLPQKIGDSLGSASCSLFHEPAIPAKTLC